MLFTIPGFEAHNTGLMKLCQQLIKQEAQLSLG